MGKDLNMRLDKFISDSCAYSRRDIKKLIRKGSVSVNGMPVSAAEMRVDETDEIAIGGKVIAYTKFVYLMLNKPPGYVSATEDKHYPVVTDLVPEEYAHYNVFPVGRLDIDTEGLLLLTNDGAFNHAVTSPKKDVYKRYFARLDKSAQSTDIKAFAAGMKFKDFTAKPARLEITDNPFEVYAEIAEGKFHQVKRMFERIGKTVVFLKRVAIGGLTMPENLKSGEIKECSKEELEELVFGEIIDKKH